jgi:oxygen-independent coproporphyrinogen-3 oxidase
MNTERNPCLEPLPLPLFGGLYVHVPFCVEKCGYCAFYSLPDSSEGVMGRYLERIECDIAEVEDRLMGLTSVFVGGGTPTALSQSSLERLLSVLKPVVERAGTEVEWTVEINPAHCTDGHAGQLIEAGVNRLSFGVQSFDPALLDRLGRQAPESGRLRQIMNCCRRNGLKNFNIDLIYGIPGQTLGGWREDLTRACDLGVAHLSTYELTVEEGSRLGKGYRGEIVDADLAVDMWHLAGDVSGAWGVRRYEVSNLAKPGLECRHNWDVWHGSRYFGIGPAASSFDGARRWSEVASLDQWLGHAPVEYDDLSRGERLAEVFAFGLRTVAGWSPGEFKRRTGSGVPDECLRACCMLADEGLLSGRGDAWKPTERGLLFSDTVIERLLLSNR